MTIPDGVLYRILSSTRSIRFTAEEWEHQYSSGRWEYLSNTSEMARYSIIAGYCGLFGKPNTILDIGCGEGILAERLGQNYNSFLGIDLSECAVEAARGRSFPSAEFRIDNAETFEPEGMFDVIIFNEVLYYFSDPILQINRYACNLNTNGIIIVSIFHGLNKKLIWPIIEKNFQILDKIIIYHANKNAWTVAVLRLRNQQQSSKIIAG